MNGEEALKSAVRAAAERVFEATGGEARYEEHILLPYFGGNIMVRFELDRERITPDELDGLEHRLYAFMPEGLLLDFMGGVYRRAGYEFENIADKFVRCADAYRSEEIPLSPFYDEIAFETRELLRAVGLDENAPVWEIQPGDETELILLGEGCGALGSAEYRGRTVNASFADSTACEGLMKAALYAKKNGVSLMRAVEKAAQGRDKPTE